MNFKNKNILVTGADGFIGSHLVELLCLKGANVHALVQYNSFNSWGWLENLDCLSSINIKAGDIRDSNYCDELTSDIDIVFHLASLIGIPYSYSAPSSYFDTNVKGTLNICQAALNNKVIKIVHTSTSEVYGTAQYVPIDESHPLQAQSPYSASKIAADAIAISFFNSFDLPVTIARPFNTYGPRQSERAVIPSIITQILHGAKRIKLGDVSPTRDFNYVTDTCEGLLALAESKKTTGEVVNIGSNYEISIKNLLDLIKDIIGSDVELIVDNERMRPKKSEVLRLWCDNSKIKQLTGFSPSTDLEIGLEKTIRWFSNNDNLMRYKPNNYNI
jgi:NAD dependent epimerase/dehydratase